MTQFVSAQDAVSRIPDGCTLAVGGFNGFGTPDALLAALRERFLSSGAPRGLTLMKSVSVGDRGERGVSRIALEGLVRRVITSHVGLEPAMAKLIEESARSRISTARRPRTGRASSRTSGSKPSSIRARTAARRTR